MKEKAWLSVGSLS